MSWGIELWSIYQVCWFLTEAPRNFSILQIIANLSLNDATPPMTRSIYGYIVPIYGLKIKRTSHNNIAAFNNG